MNNVKSIKIKPLISVMIQRRFSSINRTFVYKFGNNSPLYNINIDHNDLITDSIKNGIIYSYKNFVTALKDRDVEYIKKTCEKGFAKHIIDDVVNFPDKLTLKENESIEEKVYITSIEVEAHHQITNDRDINNSSKNKYKWRPTWALHEKITRIYAKVMKKAVPNSEDLHTFHKIGKESIVRLKVNLRTNYIISNADDKLLNQLEMEDHSIILEKQTTISVEFYLYLFKVYANMFKIEPEGKPFIIADFDNYMQGNPLVKSD